MKNSNRYRGIFPAFYACYDEKGDISPDRTQKYADYLLRKGVKGLYVGGSSGECIYQNVEERKQTLQAVMEAVGGKLTIIAHVGAPSTRDSVELARHAQQMGVDAIASIPPIYFRLPEKSIERYWGDMIRATDLDFIIYNIPQTTGYSLSLDLFYRMKAMPQVVGIKNSSMPVQDIQQFKTAGGEDFIIFNGPDEQYVGGRIMGADSGIGGTYGVMPELFLLAERFVDEGKVAKAGRLQADINGVISSLCGFSGSMYAAAKAVVKLQGVDIGTARLPMEPIDPSEQGKVEEIYHRIEQLKEQYAK